MQPSSINILSSIAKNLNLIKDPETLAVFSGICKVTEAVAQRCSIKKVFLEILQNSRENTCVN